MTNKFRTTYRSVLQITATRLGEKATFVPGNAVRGRRRCVSAVIALHRVNVFRKERRPDGWWTSSELQLNIADYRYSSSNKHETATRLGEKATFVPGNAVRGSRRRHAYAYMRCRYVCVRSSAPSQSTDDYQVVQSDLWHASLHLRGRRQSEGGKAHLYESIGTSRLADSG
ncbi:hypothetical protein DENSPDRAFT_594135 [Dentipellis sp. KUC8613]|nr:hypothetical protein DENSPDRAFT_594135 [Dentipellis sp. KUC8613]